MAPSPLRGCTCWPGILGAARLGCLPHLDWAVMDWMDLKNMRPPGAKVEHGEDGGEHTGPPRFPWEEAPSLPDAEPGIDLLDGLNPAQREACEHEKGPLLILAGPGSGKTRVVTHRIAHMLSSGVHPSSIAALTFTNKAAEEMRERIDRLAPNQPVWMGTFHRFCAQQLRRYASMVGLAENYSIYDMSDAKTAMKRAIAAAASRGMSRKDRRRF